MSKDFFKVIFIIAISFLFSCQKTKLTAKQLLSKSIDAHGGLEFWQKVDTLSFTKKTILYNRKGLKEKEITQHQSFYGGNFINGKITTIGTDKSSISIIGNVYTKRVGDALISISNNEMKSITNAFKSAYYVISQPFNLMESGALLSYKKDTILNDEKTFVVDVSYKEDQNTNTPDQWTYFINANTYLIVAAKVFHSPTVSFIQNINFNKETPFVFNAERESVFLNKDGSIDYLRASYFYSNYKVVLKK
ncbi:hypothetical protein OAT36_07685 [Flavobacteriaceae bacterium]|nr:hypothetical protein [Flavobacteriaceae bacterium]MDB4495922.1 hypothetical protein [Flavobacteriaceae bacterium]MDC0652021.1 hypothetical protein [Flavobacteriaceae bacterium]MDC1168773.1 hypothetical protein [Flavobacteriaceae bacterium]MDC3284819.1 hypothetical protein [Flavobacteriaceae bacterium]